MKKVLFLCKECGFLFEAESGKRPFCEKCGNRLYNTSIFADEWKTLSDKQKYKIKARWNYESSLLKSNKILFDIPKDYKFDKKKELKKELKKDKRNKEIYGEKIRSEEEKEYCHKENIYVNERKTNDTIYVVKKPFIEIDFNELMGIFQNIIFFPFVLLRFILIGLCKLVQLFCQHLAENIGNILNAFAKVFFAFIVVISILYYPAKYIRERNAESTKKMLADYHDRFYDVLKKYIDYDMIDLYEDEETEFYRNTILVVNRICSGNPILLMDCMEDISSENAFNNAISPQDNNVDYSNLHFSPLSTKSNMVVMLQYDAENDELYLWIDHSDNFEYCDGSERINEGIEVFIVNDCTCEDIKDIEKSGVIFVK